MRIILHIAVICIGNQYILFCLPNITSSPFRTSKYTLIVYIVSRACTTHFSICLPLITLVIREGGVSVILNIETSTLFTYVSCGNLFAHSTCGFVGYLGLMDHGKVFFLYVLNSTNVVIVVICQADVSLIIFAMLIIAGSLFIDSKHCYFYRCYFSCL